MDLCLLQGFDLRSSLSTREFSLLGKEEDTLSKLELPEPVQHDCFERSIRIVGSSNGLVCLHFRKGPPTSEINVVWNPAIGQYRYLPEPLSLDEGLREDTLSSILGFGFTHTSDYKMLRISRSRDRNGCEGFTYLTQVFTRSENSWREVKDCFPFGDYNFYVESSTTSTGVVYWLARRHVLGNNCPSGDYDVLSFNLHDEVIQKISLPSEFLNDYNCVFRLYSWKNSIGLLAWSRPEWNGPCKNDVWGMTEQFADDDEYFTQMLSANRKWTKLFTIDLPDRNWYYGIPFGVWNDQFLWAKRDTAGENFLYAYDPASQEERKLCRLREEINYGQVVDYKESLAPVL